MKTELFFVMVAATLPALSSFAEIEPVSPAEGAVVQLVPNMQKKVMDLPTYDERLACLQADRKSDKKMRHGKDWNKSTPFEFKWRATEGEKGPWKILIGKKSDLSDARVWYKSKSEDKKSKAKEFSFQPSYANLEVATRYYWQVIICGRCESWQCSPNHDCKESKTLTKTAIASFVTEDYTPRWIAIKGRVGNMRDLGGYKAANGCRVRQGMAFRAQGLNDNSAYGETAGENRLMVSDVKYMIETLGVKTDLDLRSSAEIAGMKESPLGPNVKFVHVPSSAYGSIFGANGKKSMAKNFRLFCDRKNYPILFHCIGGADRTGSLAYVLNGVLGVDRHYLETDWEETFYPELPEMASDYTGEKFWRREQYFTDGFSKYGDAGSSWSDRIVLYLKSCGITDEEINAFRSIMLEKCADEAGSAK